MRNEDFRTKRCPLPPEAFANGSPGPDLPPSDLVREEVWSSIVSLPDHVMIRTSDHHGTQLWRMHELWGDWIENFDSTDGVVRNSMLVVSDELQASVFLNLCGYYQPAAASLRTALETMTIDSYLQLISSKDVASYHSLTFNTACNCIVKEFARIKSLEEALWRKMGFGIFNQKPGPGKSRWKEAGWARRLYSELCDFTHSRSGYSALDTWDGSNGPIYVDKSFGKNYALYCDVYALLHILIKLAKSETPLPRSINHLFGDPCILPSKVATFTYHSLWGQDFTEKISHLNYPERTQVILELLGIEREENPKPK